MYYLSSPSVLSDNIRLDITSSGCNMIRLQLWEFHFRVTLYMQRYIFFLSNSCSRDRNPHMHTQNKIKHTQNPGFVLTSRNQRWTTVQKAMCSVGRRRPRWLNQRRGPLRGREGIRICVELACCLNDTTVEEMKTAISGWDACRALQLQDSQNERRGAGERLNTPIRSSRVRRGDPKSKSNSTCLESACGAKEGFPHL